MEETLSVPKRKRYTRKGYPMSAQLKHEIIEEFANDFGGDMFGGEGASMFTSCAAPESFGSALTGEAVDMFTSCAAPVTGSAATGEVTGLYTSCAAPLTG